MRLMAYNILKGSIGRERLLAEVIQAVDADIVLLEEADYPPAVATIARRAGYPDYASRRFTSTAFMSRVPVQHQWHRVWFARSPFLEVIPEGRDLRIWGVHVIALLSNLTEHIRWHEIRALLNRVNPKTPHVLIGDFNTLAPGDSFDTSTMPWFLQAALALSGGDISRKTIRLLLEAGYTDAFREKNPADNGWSLPAWQPNTRLDYAFISPHLKNSVTDCRLMREPEIVQQASDHLPVVLELTLKADHGE